MLEKCMKCQAKKLSSPSAALLLTPAVTASPLCLACIMPKFLVAAAVLLLLCWVFLYFVLVFFNSWRYSLWFGGRTRKSWCHCRWRQRFCGLRQGENLIWEVWREQTDRAMGSMGASTGHCLLWCWMWKPQVWRGSSRQPHMAAELWSVGRRDRDLGAGKLFLAVMLG